MKKTILTFLLILGILAPFPSYALTPAVILVDYDQVKKDLTDYIREEMEKHNVKGLSVALVDDQQTVWLKGFGRSDDKKKVPATGETLYPVGALSRLFTAAEVLKLSDQGKVRLDAPLKRYLPGFSIHDRFMGSKPVTPRSLLAQHSGMPGFFLKGIFSDSPDSLEKTAADLGRDYLTAPPGTLYKYSYVDYDLLGRLVEVKRKKEFASAMREDLLAPLGMDDSTFEDTPLLQGRLAQGYRGGKETPFSRMRDVPATGMFSTASDMARFMKRLFGPGKDFLAPKTIEAMFSPQYPGLEMDFGQRTGLGWSLSGVEIEGSEGAAWQDGYYPPYFSRMVVLPERKLGLVLLSNSIEAQKLAKNVTERALKLMLRAKYGLKADLSPQKVEMPPAFPMPTGTLDGYTGTYSAFGQNTLITREGDRLSAEMAHLKLDLVPVAPDTFVPRVVILFLFPINLPQYPMVFSNFGGKKMAVLRGLPFVIPLERIEPVPVPGSWRDRMGDYEAEGPDDLFRFNKVTLGEKDGFMTVTVRITVNAFNIKDEEYKVALLPLSDEDAVVPGHFYGDGGTLHMEEKGGMTRAFYSGFWFRKLPGPGTKIITVPETPSK